MFALVVEAGGVVAIALGAVAFDAVEDGGGDVADGGSDAGGGDDEEFDGDVHDGKC